MGKNNAQAWETRRRKYGPRGHDSSYSRPTAKLSYAIKDSVRLARLVGFLIADSVLSEGQVRDIIEAAPWEVTRLRDDGRAALFYRPVRGRWGAAAMKRIAEEL